jgi:2-polyprenyl-3-methyl-5-hydroxy-6-metoxy-1,4-benzoquinol methylase
VSTQLGHLAPTPAAIWSIIQGHTLYWITNAAVQLGVFAALRDGPRSAAHLASTLPAAPAQLEVLLDALVGAGLLRRADDAFTLTEVSQAFLVPGGERYMGDLVLHSPGLHENWPLLAGTVAGGAPVFPVDDDVRFWRSIGRAAFTTQYGLARRTAEMLGLCGEKPLRILDVGAGAAPWSVAFLEMLPAAGAVANDLPDVVDLARESAEHHGVAERLQCEPGDFRVLGFVAQGYDVVVLANVVRTEGESGAPRLLRRAAGWLRPGGLLLVADYFLDEERSQATTALLLGATMMANTVSGRTFTISRHREWLRDAGLGNVDVLEPLPNNQVLVARHA